MNKGQLQLPAIAIWVKDSYAHLNAQNGKTVFALKSLSQRRILPNKRTEQMAGISRDAIERYGFNEEFSKSVIFLTEMYDSSPSLNDKLFFLDVKINTNFC
jgi:hypothetical protein